MGRDFDLLTKLGEVHSQIFKAIAQPEGKKVSEKEINLSKTKFLFWGSLALLLVSLVAWLVNLEVALQSYSPGLVLISDLLPSWLYLKFAWLSADLSTISTLVSVLLFLFPCLQGWKVLRAGNDVLQRREIASDPYPLNFSYFLVMLGLAGTLYGLLIGLDVSGVKELGEGGQTVDEIKGSLDQLLGGTATALLSSLLGLIGAFLAAKPLSWCFQWATELSDDEDLSLTETIERLVGDMHSLGDASRAFGERLHGTSIQDVPNTLVEIKGELAGLKEELARANQRIEGLGDSQKQGQEMLAPLQELRRLGNLETLLGRIGDAHDAGNETDQKMLGSLETMHQDQLDQARKLNEDFEGLAGSLRTMEECLTSLKESGVSGSEKLEETISQIRSANATLNLSREEAEVQREKVVSLLNSAEADRRAERIALRNAFGQFATTNVPIDESEFQ
jgi:predicted  nucleic acid-binding Zn-ribbon protein